MFVDIIVLLYIIYNNNIIKVKKGKKRGKGVIRYILDLF